MSGGEGAASRAFEMLEERIQRWIWLNQWTELRDIQERAIPAILSRSGDVILAAATASGKTEAAFFPILSALLAGEARGLAVYISPLAALINDQFRRLGGLCGELGIPVHPWHGGVSATVKRAFFDNPAGVLLITPESLQALFCNHGIEIPRLFERAGYIVVDELHSFIGGERGKQLQSLLHFIEERTRRVIPRIGLSATLGDMNGAACFLSERRGALGSVTSSCNVIISEQERGALKLLLKGVLQGGEAGGEGEEDACDKSAQDASEAVADYLFTRLRGKNNLIFPNSRGKVELYTHLLSARCERAGIENEFFAHHGNLARDIRSEAEEALRSRTRAATVICTNTLELGIDIGEVESVVQIECPPSVSSLRQRLGRSGRRYGVPAVLRAFAAERPRGINNHPFSELRESVFSMCACILLMLEQWCEPPRSGGLHLSTLVQQTLGLVLERGGIAPEAAFDLLCARGPFNAVSRRDYFILLKSLISRELLEQDSRGALLLGEKGERCAAHFSFYAAFASQTEYRIVTEKKTLGTLPVNTSVQKNDFIIFAGKTWKIAAIDDGAKTIEVRFFGEGRPPVFSGGGWSIHRQVREKMRELYESKEAVPFADSTAARLIEEGREAYRDFGLAGRGRRVLEKDKYAVLVTWLSDRANRTLQLLLRKRGWTAYTGGLGLTLPGRGAEEAREMLAALAAESAPDAEELLDGSQNLCVGKWDWTLPPRLLKANYASLYLDAEEAGEWLKTAEERL
ncbi:MAG: DEAD/DEAH box helicase [Spirochaetaceae bacterium]|jgi:ATP-dependent Lhr-like helicase|nr:DEAD/DEAH box helicase [Spirochaetaceae bacterium]